MKNKKQRRVMFLLILILGLTIGFALLSTTLKINGTAGIKSNTWNIHWNDESINVNSGSVEANLPVVSKTTSNKDTVSFDVELELPGDFYEFEIDAINEGSIDGALDLSENWITYKIDNVEGNLPSYMDFSVKYDDNTTPQSGDVLAHGERKTYRIRVEYKSNVEELPENPDSVEIVVEIPYIQYKENCPEPVSFSTDEWSTIACNVKKGNTSAYSVGDIKSVDMGSFGTHSVRISNKSTPSECSQSNYSQSACGFVLEFTDSLTTHVMNPYTGTSVIGDGNYGGWEHSEMRTYVNADIFGSLPTELQDIIADTQVVSSRGSHDSDNFITTDKLYLLSYREVWLVAGSDSMNDTSYNDTRQLDYYSERNTTTQNYSAASKDFGTMTNFWWWLRSADITSDSNFYYVMGDGMKTVSGSFGTAGVSPAFRIG